MQRTLKKLTHYFQLLRPQQWLKNSFIWVGILFGHAWANSTILYQVIAATIAFCLLSSSVYIINDIFDYEFDRLHPEKKLRPIPAGLICLPIALTIAACLSIVAIAIGFYITINIGIILLIYAALNILYSYQLKNIVIIDVFIIACGFMLRIFAGTYGVGIPPSHWLLLCGMLLTLFLGFTKRRAEYTSLQNTKINHRKVFRHYNLKLLDNLIAVCAAGTIISYSLYTVSPETTQFHHTKSLFYTIPFVIYGLFRYLYLLYSSKLVSGQDISKEILHDKQLLIVVLGWFFLTYYLLM